MEVPPPLRWLYLDGCRGSIGIAGDEMEFIQIIECRTNRIEEIQKLEEEWRAATEGRRTLRRSIVARDRNDRQRYLILAFFDDYDSAMANSDLPETGEFGAKQQALADAPLTFTDLDVLEDRAG